MAKDTKYHIKGILKENGFIEIANYIQLKPILDNWINRDLLCIISLFRKNRSGRQNRYLHGVVVPCAIAWALDTLGQRWSVEQAKTYIYTEVLGYSIQATITETGKEIYWFEGKRFSQMNTVQFNDCVEAVQMYFARRGKNIPNPREENTLDAFV